MFSQGELCDAISCVKNASARFHTYCHKVERRRCQPSLLLPRLYHSYLTPAVTPPLSPQPSPHQHFSRTKQKISDPIKMKPVQKRASTTNLSFMKKRRAASVDPLGETPHLGISSILGHVGQPFIESVITPLITCKICSDTFSDQNNAHVLHCGHSLCRVCISTIASSDARTQNRFYSLSCPYCRHDSTFNNFDELPRNFAILDTLELINSSTVSIACKTCDDRSSFQLGGTSLRCKPSASMTAVSGTSNYIGSADASGKAHGEGSCLWQNGCWSMGQWKHGQLFGLGGMFFKDGSIHIGDWVNGVCHGFGIFMTPDGVVRSGVWRQGKCVLYDSID